MRALEREKRIVIESCASAGAPRRICGSMTGVAGGGETRRRMVRFACGVIRGLMTTDARPGRPSKHIVAMTGGARDRGVSALQREERIVIECGTAGRAPGRFAGAMACLTRNGESSGRMVWRTRRVEILLMAGGAQHGAGLELTIAMARFTTDRAMHRIERDTSHRAVVPIDRAPRDGTMALLALGPETRLIAIVLAAYPVARVARGRRTLILLLQMTRRARHGEMAAFEAECGCIVKRAIRRLELRINRSIEHEDNAREECEEPNEQHAIHGR